MYELWNEDIKISVITDRKPYFDVYLRFMGDSSGAIVFSTFNRTKANSVAEYLKSIPRELLADTLQAFKAMQAKTQSRGV